MAQVFIPNTMPLRPLEANTAQLLQQALEEMVQQYAPLEKYEPEGSFGIAGGHTSMAYLFLKLHERHPDLQVQGCSLWHWAERYMQGDYGKPRLEHGSCGIMCEKLGADAVRACMTKQRGDVDVFLENIPVVLEPTPEGGKNPFPCEMIYGRAGTLYMLRLVRHFVPDCADLINDAIGRVSQRILASDDDGKGNWLWWDRHYLGTAHGDVGIITQLVLSQPSLAPELAARLEALLDLQTPAGNWLARPEEQDEVDQGNPGRVQYCHGAPGYIYALQSLRPFYPSLHDKIDRAMAKARGITWTNGLLVKEPNLCHGLFGNGLVFPKGPKRDHFLALATPEAVEAARKEDAEVFKAADYGLEPSALFGYRPGAAWTWSVCGDETPTMLLFNDV